MADYASSNRLIAKNTILLYLRMLLVMAVTLYTSRVVLATLGIEDYGLYDVVGGVVSMFTFISMAMGNSTNRYITFAIGKGDKQELKEVISAACVIHLSLAIIILVLAETIGLWFLHYKMVIPEGRMYAANWVYQFSVLACMISITSVPYNAMVIAHEKMGAFAFISVLDALLKLLIVFIIQKTGIDKLILYAGLLLCVNLIDRIIYQCYCVNKFEEAKKIKLSTKFVQFRGMTHFAGWSMIGNLIYLGYTQGINLMLNVFFGTAVNAARGVAFQVQNAMKGFVTNFQTALNPQLIKSYAQNDLVRHNQLIFSSSRLSFYLTLCMVLPLFMEADGILSLWLVEVPEYSSVFLRLILLVSLISPLENPLGISNNATGNIKKFQMVIGLLSSLIVVFAYIVLKLGFEPYSVFVIQFIVSLIVLFVRVYIVKQPIHMSFRDYISKVLLRVLLVTIIAAIIPSIIHFWIDSPSFLALLLKCMIGFLSAAVVSFYLGLESNERYFIVSRVKSIVLRIVKTS